VISNKFELLGDEFDQGAYNTVLDEIIEEDRQHALQLIPLLAIRGAIRVMPLVVVYGHFNFWMQDKQDNRIRHLAGLLGVINLANGSIPAVYDDAANAARANNTAATAANAARVAARVAAGDDNDDVVAASSATYAARAAAAAAVAAEAAARADADADAAAAAAAYAARVARKNPTITNALFDVLKADLSLGITDISALQHSPLWENAPEWFSTNVERLENIIAGLPRKGTVESWRQIDSGMEYLKIQAGIKNDHDSNETITQQSSAREHLTLFSFEANNQSHPETPAKADKLNRQKLVNALAVNLVSPTNSHHRAIGLLGEWGSGKSTVLDLLKQRLKELNAEQPFIFGEFNAWAYEHTENIQAGVAQEMINALTGSPDVLQPLYTPTVRLFEKLKTILSSDVRKLFAAILNAIPVSSNMSLRWFGERCALTIKFAYKVHPVELLKILLLLLVAAMPWFSEWFQGLIEFSASPSNKSSWIWTGGVFLYTLREFGKLIISPQAKELLTYLRLPNYAEHLGTIPVMRKHICTLCNLRLKEKNGKTPRLLFVVDDLDRCSPSAIVKVLEAVRLVLDLDNVIVIIAIDQHIALAALSEHFKDFSPHHKFKNSHAIAREYLSKVINLPIVLTKPSSDDVKVFMDSFWDEMNKELDKETDKERDEKSESKSGVSGKADLPSRGNATAANASEIEDLNKPKDAISGGSPAQDAISESVKLAEQKRAEEIESTAPVVKPIKALSKDQQASFIYWVNYFELSNSRQLKRLNNSYDLMRSYLPLLDKEALEFALPESPPLKTFPMLLTLILMEYLNSLHDLNARNQLWDQLFIESATAPVEEVSNKIVTAGFVKAYRSLSAAGVNQHLVAKVEAFVLPAMN